MILNDKTFIHLFHLSFPKFIQVYLSLRQLSSVYLSLPKFSWVCPSLSQFTSVYISYTSYTSLNQFAQVQAKFIQAFSSLDDINLRLLQVYPKTTQSLPWYCPEITLKITWEYPELTLGLPWFCPEITPMITLRLHRDYP